jgi:hypothetical protein
MPSVPVSKEEIFASTKRTNETPLLGRGNERRKKRIERGILFQSQDFQGRVRAFLTQSENQPWVPSSSAWSGAGRLCNSA